MRGGFLGMGDRYLARKRAGIPSTFSRLSNVIDGLITRNRFMLWLDDRFFEWVEGKQTRFQGFITLSIMWIVGVSPLLIFILFIILLNSRIY